MDRIPSYKELRDAIPSKLTKPMTAAELGDEIGWPEEAVDEALHATAADLASPWFLLKCKGRWCRDDIKTGLRVHERLGGYLTAIRGIDKFYDACREAKIDGAAILSGCLPLTELSAKLIPGWTGGETWLQDQNNELRRDASHAAAVLAQAAELLRCGDSVRKRAFLDLVEKDSVDWSTICSLAAL